MVILATSERRSLVVDEPVNFRKGTIVRLVKGQAGDPMDGTAESLVERQAGGTEPRAP